LPPRFADSQIDAAFVLTIGVPKQPIPPSRVECEPDATVIVYGNAQPSSMEDPMAYSTSYRIKIYIL